MSDYSFLQNIEGGWKQLKNWCLHKRSDTPSDSMEGGVWYNETSKRIGIDIGNENKELAFVGEEHNSLLDKDGGDTVNNYYGHVKQIHNNILENFGEASGVIVSDANNYIPIEQIPVGLLGGLTPKGAWNPATNTPTLSNPPLATTRGWFYIASTSGTALGTDWASTDWCISDGTVWQKIDNTDKVSSVFGRTGNVVAANGDYNLDQVNDGTTYKRITSTEKTNYNTAYNHSQLTASNPHGTTAAQISSTATGDVAATNVQAAIAELASEKQASIPVGTTLQYYRGDKVWATLDKAAVGLGNVDNTSDANKPISTAMQTALNDKSPLNTTLADNAGSTTLPTTASGTLVSKIQQIRDYLKYLLNSIDSCFNDDPFEIQPTTDLNSIVNSGSYRIFSSVAFSATYNQPVGAYTYGQLRVFVGRVGQVYQEYHPDRSVNTNTRTVYRRNKFAASNEWSSWVRDVTTDDLAGVFDALNGKVPIKKNHWNATYLGDTYRYVKIASITTSDSDYTTHCLFVGKSFFDGQHYLQGMLYIAQNGFGTGSHPVLTFIGQANNSNLVYTFNDTTNLLEIYLYCSGGGGGGLVNCFTTNIITSTDPSRITLLTSGNPVTSVPGAIDVYRIQANARNSQTTLDGDVYVAGNVQADYIAEMSAWSDNPNYARFGHKNFNTTGGYGFLQTISGYVNISAPSDTGINFNINNANKVWITSDGYTHVVAPSTDADDATVVTSAWVKDVAAPISHASSSETYGRSTASNYGHSKASSSPPVMDGTAAAVGTDDGTYARGDHVHPSDTSKANKAYYNNDSNGKLTISSGSTNQNIEIKNGTTVVAYTGIEALPLLYVNTPPILADSNTVVNTAWAKRNSIKNITEINYTTTSINLTNCTPIVYITDTGNSFSGSNYIYFTGGYIGETYTIVSNLTNAAVLKVKLIGYGERNISIAYCSTWSFLKIDSTNYIIV